MPHWFIALMEFLKSLFPRKKSHITDAAADMHVRTKGGDYQVDEVVHLMVGFNPATGEYYQLGQPWTQDMVFDGDSIFNGAVIFAGLIDLPFRAYAERTGAARGDYQIILGDNAGGDYFGIYDNILGPAFRVDSDGNVDIFGDLDVVGDIEGTNIVATGNMDCIDLETTDDVIVGDNVYIDGSIYAGAIGTTWIRCVTTDLVVQRGAAGATVLRIASGSGAAGCGFYLTNDSGTPLSSATSSFGMLTGTTFAQTLQFVSDAVGNQLVITNVANRNNDHDHATQTDPTLYVHSDTDPNTANDEWISLTHDKTDGVIDVGSGNTKITDPQCVGDYHSHDGSQGHTGHIDDGVNFRATIKNGIITAVGNSIAGGWA